MSSEANPHPARRRRAFLHAAGVHQQAALVHDQAAELFAELGEPGRAELERRRAANERETSRADSQRAARWGDSGKEGPQGMKIVSGQEVAMSEVPINDEDRPVSPQDEEQIRRPIEARTTVPADAPEADFLEQLVEEPAEPDSD